MTDQPRPELRTVAIHITANDLSSDEADQLVTELRAVSARFNAAVRIDDGKPRRKYLKGEERIRVAADIKDRFEAGATTQEIAEEIGRSESTVRDLLDFIDPTARLRDEDPS